MNPCQSAVQTESGAWRLPDDHYPGFFSDLANERKLSPIRSLRPLEKKPGVISLLTGKPNPISFPFTSITFTSRSPNRDDVNDPTEITLTIKDDELVAGLQYGDTAGLKPFTDWFHGLQEFTHSRMRGEGWRSSAGTGSQDLLYKAIASIFNPGDPILVETPSYCGLIVILRTLRCIPIEVETDSCGVIPSSLRTILEQWPEGKAKPKGFYTVPYGSNPTGATAPTDRRREVLQLAREHDFLFLKAHDPYYYVYYGEGPRPLSYFALERELPEVGRVLRFDSLSKVMSAGFRIGIVSGPAPLVQAIDLYTAISNLQSSNFTQAVVLKLVEAWGYEGFKKHCETVSAFYKTKRDIFDNVMKKHLSGLAEWSAPDSGMFIWFKLFLPGEGGSEAIIQTMAHEESVVLLPGTASIPSGKKTAYVRACFSLTSEEDVDEVLSRLRRVLLRETGNS